MANSTLIDAATEAVNTMRLVAKGLREIGIGRLAIELEAEANRLKDVYIIPDPRNQLIAELREVCSALLNEVERVHLNEPDIESLVNSAAKLLKKTGSIKEALRKSHQAGGCAWDGVTNPADLLGRDGVSEQEPEVKHG